jgi:hypothetical protein
MGALVVKADGVVQGLDPNVPVLIMKLGHYPLHHGVMGAIRSLGRAGVPVYGVHEDRLAPAGLSKYLVGRFIWPTAADDPQEDRSASDPAADRRPGGGVHRRAFRCAAAALPLP